MLTFHKLRRSPLYQKLITNISPHLPLLLIVILAILIFSPALGNFFSGDDWFHLKVVQISSLSEFLNFLNPVFNPQSTAFYRPIPNQLFFFFFYRMFGLWALPYFLGIFLIFGVTILLFYRLLAKNGFSHPTALIATFIYSVSQTHFARLNFLSAGQEVMMSCFVLAGLVTNTTEKRYRLLVTKVTIFFVLALLSKDNAIVFPLLVLIFDWLKKRQIDWTKMIILSLVAAVYLFIRFVVFNSPLTQIETYTLNFSPKLTLNTLYFYGLWAVGGPELLQDYLVGPLTLIDRFWTDFGSRGTSIIVLLVASIASLAALFFATKHKIKALLPLVLFVITLGPVLFLPLHKFTIQMSLPLMCWSVFVAQLCASKPKWVIVGVVSLLLGLNILSIQITRRTHYSVQRSNISHRVYDFFKTNHPDYPDQYYLVFSNANTAGSDIPQWGSSQQISYALWGSNFAKVFFQRTDAELYYEDIPYTPPDNKQPLLIDSTQFLVN